MGRSSAFSMFSFLVNNCKATLGLLADLGRFSKQQVSMAPAFEELNSYPQACANCYVSHDTQRLDWQFCNTCEGAWKSYPYAGPQYPFSWKQSPGSSSDPAKKK